MTKGDLAGIVGGIGAGGLAAILGAGILVTAGAAIAGVVTGYNVSKYSYKPVYKNL